MSFIKNTLIHYTIIAGCTLTCSANNFVVSREGWMRTGHGYTTALGNNKLALGSGWNVQLNDFSRTLQYKSRIVGTTDWDDWESRPIGGFPPPFPENVHGDYGHSVSLSGEWVTVGAPGSGRATYTFVGGFPQYGDPLQDEGVVHVWRDQNGEKIDAQILRGPNTEAEEEASSFPPAGDRFGHSVDVDGGWLIVGAPWEASAATGVNGNFTDTQYNDDDSAPGRGAAYIYQLVGGEWQFHTYLKPSDPHHGVESLYLNYGHSVAIRDGYAIVGAPGSTSQQTPAGWQVNLPGTAYIYRLNGGEWMPDGKLEAHNKENDDSFGVSVDIENGTCVVGAHREDSAATTVNGNGEDNTGYDRGAAYVFTRGLDGWYQSAYLKAPVATTSSHAWGSSVEDPFRAAGPAFGTSVSLSGHRLLVGAPGEGSSTRGADGDATNTDAHRSGAAYLFENIGGGQWQLAHYLKSHETQAGARFGHSVSLWNELMLIGSPALPGGDLRGMAELFEMYLPSPEERMFREQAAAAGLPAYLSRPFDVPFDDGITNLEKYAFNMDLGAPDVRAMQPGSNQGLPWAGVVETSGGNGEKEFRLEYLRRRNSGLYYIPQISTDLSEGSFDSAAGDETVTPVNDQWERVVLVTELDPAQAPKGFARVSVYLPVPQ